MKLEINEAEEVDSKIMLDLSYDQEFYDTVCRAYGVEDISTDDVEGLIMMVLEELDSNDLRELRDKVYQSL